VPDLPDFQRFPTPRDEPESATQEGHIARGVLQAYDAAGTASTSRLDSKGDSTRLAKGPECVSAKFVIPYPPGFPIIGAGARGRHERDHHVHAQGST